MSTINIFETFAGIGAQHKALSRLKNRGEIEDFTSLGISEWYISAIIAYALIHHNEAFGKMMENIEKAFEEKEMTKETLLTELDDFTFSTDSKNPTRNQSINLETLKQLYCAVKVSNNLGSVLELQSEEMPKNIDVLTYSFPCQDLSNAGLKKGLEKGTRSGLLWEIGRIVEGMKDKDRPNVLLMENVPTLFQKFRDGWNVWVEQLKEFGYETHEILLDSSDFDIPQMRRRAFAISFKTNGQIDKEYVKNFNISKAIKETETFKNADKKLSVEGYKPQIRSILDKNVDEKYYINKPFNIKNSTDGKTGAKFDLIDHSSYEIANRIYDIDYCSPTITTSGMIKIWEDGGKKTGLRNIKEVEAFQLMGFDKEDFYKVEKNFTKGHLYRFAGNSIVVNVLEGLFEVINKIIKK